MPWEPPDVFNCRCVEFPIPTMYSMRMSLPRREPRGYVRRMRDTIALEKTMVNHEKRAAAMGPSREKTVFEELKTATECIDRANDKHDASMQPITSSDHYPPVPPGGEKHDNVDVNFTTYEAMRDCIRRWAADWTFEGFNYDGQFHKGQFSKKKTLSPFEEATLDPDKIERPTGGSFSHDVLTGATVHTASVQCGNASAAEIINERQQAGWIVTKFVPNAYGLLELVFEKQGNSPFRSNSFLEEQVELEKSYRLSVQDGRTRAEAELLLASDKIQSLGKIHDDQLHRITDLVDQRDELQRMIESAKLRHASQVGRGDDWRRRANEMEQERDALQRERDTSPPLIERGLVEDNAKLKDEINHFRSLFPIGTTMNQHEDLRKNIAELCDTPSSGSAIFKLMTRLDNQRASIEGMSKEIERLEGNNKQMIASRDVARSTATHWEKTADRFEATCDELRRSAQASHDHGDCAEISMLRGKLRDEEGRHAETFKSMNRAMNDAGDLREKYKSSLALQVSGRLDLDRLNQQADRMRKTNEGLSNAMRDNHTYNCRNCGGEMEQERDALQRERDKG